MGVARWPSREGWGDSFNAVACPAAHISCERKVDQGCALEVRGSGGEAEVQSGEHHSWGPGREQVVSRWDVPSWHRAWHRARHHRDRRSVPGVVVSYPAALRTGSGV